MATKVEVVGRLGPNNFTMEQQSTNSQVAYELVIPGGLLNQKNSLELLMQIGTRANTALITPKRTELRQVAAFPNDGWDRSSWGLISIVNGVELAYQRVAFSNGDVFVMKHTGTNSAEAIISQLGVYDGGTWSVLCSGASDRPAFTGVYIGEFANTALMILDPETDTLTAYANGDGDLLTTNAVWLLKGDHYYSFNGYPNIGGGGPGSFRKVDITAVPPTLVASNTTDFDGTVWISAATFTDSYIYAMSYDYLGLGLEHILKIDINTLAIVDYFDVTTPSPGYKETIFAVSDDLIYYTSQAASNEPLQVWTWVGNTGGDAVLIDDDVEDFDGWIIYGYFNIFPSFKIMQSAIVGSERFLYVSSNGHNGNTTTILKIGGGIRQPLCP